MLNIAGAVAIGMVVDYMEFRLDNGANQYYFSPDDK